MIGQFKKIKKFSDIKEGDNFVLYHHQSVTSKTVKKVYYHADDVYKTQVKCTRLKSDGTTYRDRWYDTEIAIFEMVNKRNDVFADRYGGSCGELYYADADIPCGLCINSLMEQKRKINKSIMDLQKLMHSVE